MPNVLASERKRLNLSQNQLGEMLGGKSRSTIARWEDNISLADGGALKQMAQIFNCSSDYLLGITDERLPVGKAS